ncbi:MAG: hypothetical protein JRE57_16705, partial [Deltaproteobacteria bacterium]|nr:hypothetical protein [Deltaproteobacteria bacterium]
MKAAFVAFVFAIGILVPGIAASDPSDCGRLMYQINHYEGMVGRAEQFGKDD